MGMIECDNVVATTINDGQFTIMIIDDEQSILKSFSRYFSKSSYRLLLANNGEKGLKLLENNVVNLMILDLKMPGIGGMKVLERAMEIRPSLKVIIQTGYGCIPDAVQAMKYGAIDFLIKGGSLEIFQDRIHQVYETWLLDQKHRTSCGNLEDYFLFDGLVGESPSMQILKNQIMRVAPTDTTVLIQGESGTGKELIAKALHQHSQRNNNPFVAVDCASINESILESELFGHVKGAYTGAETSSKGLIRSADSGTLFLDEIGEVSLAVQAKLLRTIQERTIRPVGSTDIHYADVRIIAATNRNLFNEVARQSFRQDLYYRLSTITLNAPPLRDRGNDIELLTRYILGQCTTVEGKAIVASPEAIKICLKYQWPGNVRELENVLRRAAVFSDTGTIYPQDLPPIMMDMINDSRKIIKPETVAASEKEAIRRALEITNYNRKESLDILGISEATLYRKRKKYNL